MAITWGGWAARDSYYKQRVGIDLTRSGNTFTVRYYVETTGSMYYNGYTLNRGGNITGGVSFNWNTGSANTMLVNTATFTGAAGTTCTFTASLRLFWGGTASVSRSGSIPIDRPSAPTSVVATRASDTQANLSWNYSSPSSAPVQAVAVERTDATSNYGTWKRVATLNPAKKSWTDTGIKAGNRYQWRIRTGNSSGDSSWVGSARVSTTPLPPTNVKAQKNADGSITVSWTPPTASYGTSFYIFDNGTQVGTVARDQSSWTHSSPSTSVTHTYTVRTREDTGSLTSADSAPSNSVQLLAAPSAPTGLTPNGTAVASDQGEFQISWVHNPVDTSAQTAAEYRVRTQGNTWSTGTTTTEQSTVLEPELFPAGSTVEWQVRTQGAYHPGQEDGWSPWSAVATFRFASTPGVSISVPSEDTITVSTLTAEWTWFQAEGAAQASAQVQLQDADGILLEDRTVSGAATLLTLATRLADATSYTLLVRGRSGDGLWSEWDRADFAVSYPQPLAPEPTVTWDDTQGVAQVSIFNPGPKADSPAVGLTLDAYGQPQAIF